MPFDHIVFDRVGKCHVTFVGKIQMDRLKSWLGWLAKLPSSCKVLFFAVLAALKVAAIILEKRTRSLVIATWNGLMTYVFWSEDAAPQQAKDGHGHHPETGWFSLRTLWNSLSALGIVYGDIGTSPLYALRAALGWFRDSSGVVSGHRVPIILDNVLGVVSLINWTLLIVVTLKYVAFVLRADNRGEGGIMSLMVLVTSTLKRRGYMLAMTGATLAGVFGSALIYGDGVLTPAVSVLAAVEGLGTAYPILSFVVVPLACLILIGLFSVQSKGTGKVGKIFGPIMLLWFLFLGGEGLYNILVYKPEMLYALSPVYAIKFLIANPLLGSSVMGGVFLVATGGEALYADMGHFGPKAIRIAWMFVVAPSLMLQYMGQGAIVLVNPEAKFDPFFAAVHLEGEALAVFVIFPTIATIIASQALISGVFSLTAQAIQLGLLPRMPVYHTDANERGQIYVPVINWVVCLMVILTVIGFGSSGALESAYGIAVSLCMLFTTGLMMFASFYLWHWRAWVVAAVWGPILILETFFVYANGQKIAHGGWYPLLMGAVLFTIMTTFKRGQEIKGWYMSRMSLPVERYLAAAQDAFVNPKTAIALTAAADRVPLALRAILLAQNVRYAQTVLATVVTADEPYWTGDRVTWRDLGNGMWEAIIHYGFMEQSAINVPLALAQSHVPEGVDIDGIYILGRDAVVPHQDVGAPVEDDQPAPMAYWREKLFELMIANAQNAVTWFKVPPGRFHQIGISVVI